MELKDLQKLRELAKNDLQFDDENLSSKLSNHPVTCQRYTDKLMQEKLLLGKLEIEKENLYSKKYHTYKFEGDYKLSSAKEIDIYVKGDKDYDSILKRYNEKVIIVNLLDETLKNIRNMGFSMKQYFDLKSFLAGN